MKGPGCLSGIKRVADVKAKVYVPHLTTERLAIAIAPKQKNCVGVESVEGT